MIPGEHSYIQLTTKFLNKVFGEKEKSHLFWKECSEKTLNKRFPTLKGNLISDYRKYIKDYTISDGKGTTLYGFCVLLEKLSSLVGFNFRGNSFSNFITEREFYEFKNPFYFNDLLSLDEKVKSAQLISHSQGVILRMQANATKKNRRYAENIYLESLKHFRLSLSVARNQRTFRNIGDVYTKLKFYSLAEIFYAKAIEINEGDSISHYKYAYFLFRYMHDNVEAKKKTLKYLTGYITI